PWGADRDREPHRIRKHSDRVAPLGGRDSSGHGSWRSLSADGVAGRAVRVPSRRAPAEYERTKLVFCFWSVLDPVFALVLIPSLGGEFLMHDRPRPGIDLDVVDLAVRRLDLDAVDGAAVLVLDLRPEHGPRDGRSGCLSRLGFADLRQGGHAGISRPRWDLDAARVGGFLGGLRRPGLRERRPSEERRGKPRRRNARGDAGRPSVPYGEHE